MDDDAVDFAVAAWREDGLWQVVMLPPHAADTLDSLIGALRAQPGEGGVLGLVSVAEEFFVLVRVLGEDVRLLLSDLLRRRGLAARPRRARPPRRALARGRRDRRRRARSATCASSRTSASRATRWSSSSTTPTRWPDELLAAIAHRLGFGEQFDLVLEQLPD